MTDKLPNTYKNKLESYKERREREHRERQYLKLKRKRIKNLKKKRKENRISLAQKLKKLCKEKDFFVFEVESLVKNSKLSKRRRR